MLISGATLQNRYEIVEPIGKGGMGAVYLAKDTRLGSVMAHCRVLRDLRRNRMKPPMGPPRGVPDP